MSFNLKISIKCLRRIGIWITIIIIRLVGSNFDGIHLIILKMINLRDKIKLNNVK